MNYPRIGLRAGAVGFLAATVLIVMSMGFPLLSILSAIPVGMIAGRAILRSSASASKEAVMGASLRAGALTALGPVLVLLAIIFVSPPGATIRPELPKWIDPNIVPESLNSIPVAMAVAAVFSAAAILVLTAVSCSLTVGRNRPR